MKKENLEKQLSVDILAEIARDHVNFIILAVSLVRSGCVLDRHTWSAAQSLMLVNKNVKITFDGR